MYVCLAGGVVAIETANFRRYHETLDSISAVAIAYKKFEEFEENLRRIGKRRPNLAI